MKNAYDIVDELLRNNRTYISENELKNYMDGNIALAILQNKYNAKYISPCSTHYCGGYSFDNPYVAKKEYYKLEYCFFDDDKWENLSMYLVNDKSYKICVEVIRLDIDNHLYYNEERAEELEQMAKDIFNHILQNKVFVGKQRFWRIRKVLDY